MTRADELVESVALSVALLDEGAPWSSDAAAELQTLLVALLGAEGLAPEVALKARTALAAVQAAPAAGFRPLEEAVRSLVTTAHAARAGLAPAVDGSPAPAPPDEALDQETVRVVLAEGIEQLDEIERSILAAEHQLADGESVGRVFRGFHNLKSSAGALGLHALERTCHAAESVLAEARAGRATLGPRECGAILAAVDLARRGLDELAAGRPTLARDGDEALATTLALLAEAMPARAADTPAPEAKGPATPAPLSRATPAPPLASDDAGRSAHRAASFVKVDAAKLDDLLDAVGELTVAHALVARGSTATSDGRALEHLGRVVRRVRELVSAARLVAFRAALARLHRIARDAAQETQKSVALVVEGETVEADKAIVDSLGESLAHLVRNAVDHGLEPLAVRRARGKPDVGTVRVSARASANEIVVSVEDDGAGLDKAKILARARSLGLAGDDERELDDAAVAALIARPGFSTAERATRISGRGVGLDVVAREVERLRGRMEITGPLGQGTKVVLYLPLVTGALDGLVARIGDERFVLPAECVERSVERDPKAIHDLVSGCSVIEVGGDPAPIVPFASPRSPRIYVVLAAGGHRVCVAVDEVLGLQQVIVKPLGVSTVAGAAVAGAAVLGDGRIGLVVDAPVLIRTGAAWAKRARVAAPG